MFYSRKDTIINIILIVVSVLVVVSCLLLYFNRKVIIEEVVLVKDMSDSVGRIKSDKNEDMRSNNVVLDSDLEITEDGAIILRPNEPKDMKNPDDIFQEEKPNIVPRDENTKMVTSPKIEEKKEIVEDIIDYIHKHPFEERDGRKAQDNSVDFGMEKLRNMRSHILWDLYLY